MDANKSLLFQSNKGKKTILDVAYNNHIFNVLKKISEEEEGRWEVYNIVVNSLINDNCGNYVDEIKYRLTDGENPNEVILNIINRQVLEVDGLVWLLKRRIEEYIEDDFMKRFYC